jgi:AcrR family transcriptional regulator
MNPATTPHRDRRVQQGEATRAQLLAAARDLFVAQGYEQTSIEQVLERAQISRGALYHHYRTKRELYEAVLEQAETRLADATLRAAGTATNPLDALKAGCHAFLAIADEPDIRRIVLTDAPAVVGWERWREIDERHAFGLLKAGLAATPAGARLPERTRETLAHILLATLLELGMLIARAERPRQAQEDAHAALDELLKRLLTG